MSKEISDRLIGTFTRDERGRRPVYGGIEKFQTDPHWRDYILFHEYFHGDNGAGLGASHQTGWTGLVAHAHRAVRILGFEARTGRGQAGRVRSGRPKRRKAARGARSRDGDEMRAITVEPHKPDTARLEDIPEPDTRAGSVLVEAIAVGVVRDRRRDRGGQVRLGASRENTSRARARIPGPCRGRRHERGVSEGRPGGRHRPASGPLCLAPTAQSVSGTCARNGQYTERGIKEIDGFMSERWRIEPEYAIKIDRSLGLLGVLLEPTTVVTKAWEQVLAVGHRAFWVPQTVLVTGAGPIGLLAAFLGRLQGLEVHVLDRVESGTKPDLVRALGATYHTGNIAGVGFEPDVIVECTGVGQVINDAVRGIAAGGVVCLTGVGAGGITVGPATADVAAAAVLKNNVVVGSVNANKRHWYRAGQALAHADRSWLARLVTRVRATGGVHARPPAAAGRYQGRHSVCAGMTTAKGACKTS